MTPRVGFAVAIGVLAWATSASAECAWVLWETATQSDSPKGRMRTRSPEPVRAYPTKPECDRALGKALAAFKPGGTAHAFTHMDLEMQEGYVQYEGSKVGTLYGYRCLPDTVDPRGPKGSGR